MKGKSQVMEIGSKVKFYPDYDGYFSNYKGKTLTIASCCIDNLNNGYYMVTIEEIEEGHLINSLWLERAS
jgi:hypothetical protein